MIKKLKILLNQNRNKAVLYSFTTSFIARVLGLLSTIIITPLLLRHFTTEGFALWSMLIIVVNFSGFADLGMGHSLMNLLSEAKHKKTKEIEKKLIVTTVIFLLISSFILAFFSLLFNYLFNWETFFDISSQSLSHQMKNSVYLVIILFFINVPFSIIHKIQYAWLDNHVYHIWEIVQKLSIIILVYIGVKKAFSLEYFVIAFYAPFIIINIFNIFFYAKYKPTIRDCITRKYFISSIDLKIFNVILKTGVLFFLMSLLFNLGRSFDNFIIGRFSSLELVTDYEIVKKPFDLILVFIMMLSSGLWPAFGDAIHAKDYQWIKKVLKKSLITVMIFSSLGVCFLILFGNNILKIWLKEDYSFSFEMFLLMAISYFLFSINNVLSSFLGANSIIKKQIYMFFVYLIISVPLKIYGVMHYELKGLLLLNIISFFCIVLVPSLIISFNKIKSFN
ncbi:lipopolysaccharide biosynthesis protein [Olleya sp. HaHaR_3_96]|uniref:lipopolysaccharide biosynthesis protein n=1 Tax=Olleya sp. HaHaR_3_96 TaxID=2745560 RepID=UPI001C4FD1C6|nr:MATE family efflux transporter [Olleya sp. HaHaR_3_96]QXP60662.1 oligosaccharide flippase family protein [Olleya sp. HaHaR_3_96]